LRCRFETPEIPLEKLTFAYEAPALITTREIDFDVADISLGE
jgi:hypothetical protein